MTILARLVTSIKILVERLPVSSRGKAPVYACALLACVAAAPLPDMTRDSVILTRSVASIGSVQFEPNDRFDEQGAFFVKGLVGLVALALVYAVLKRF